MSAHPDRAPAVGVVEVAVDALHPGAVAEPDALGGEDAHELLAPPVRLRAAAPRIRVDDGDMAAREGEVADFPRVIGRVPRSYRVGATRSASCMSGIAAFESWTLADVRHAATGMSPSATARWSL